VLTFPVKDVNVKLDDMTPVAKDNSTMKDFDAVVIYNINQTQTNTLSLRTLVRPTPLI
jgi:hypothetical protein